VRSGSPDVFKRRGERAGAEICSSEPKELARGVIVFSWLSMGHSTARFLGESVDFSSMAGSELSKS